MPLEGIPHFRARQAWTAIVVALISLGISAGAFYYFFRPRVVEKIVDKPVDRIVEKIVPAPCPVQQPGNAKSSKPLSPTVSTSGGNSPAVGSVTQGAGSAFSIGQQGGITAGTINYATPDRRLTDDQKTTLEKCLKSNAGKFSVLAVSGVAKAYKYARDWSEVFSAAGWRNENPIPVASIIAAQGDWSGLRFSISGSWDDIKKQASVRVGSPERDAYQCISTAHDIVGGGLFTPYPEMETGYVRITVGDY